MKRTLLVLLAAIVLCASIAALWWSRTPLTDARAADLVREYNRRVIEAFRTKQPKLVESIASAEEAGKISGLIGAKADGGVTLDSHLLALDVRGVERKDGEVLVRTAERWRYVERRIGTGVPTGPAAEDQYDMRYHLGRDHDAWVVRRIEFMAKPVARPLPAEEPHK